MVASSPVRHDSPIGVLPLEVQAYQPPWKALSDFALHADLEQPHQPAFQQLVNQVKIIVQLLWNIFKYNLCRCMGMICHHHRWVQRLDRHRVCYQHQRHHRTS